MLPREPGKKQWVVASRQNRAYQDQILNLTLETNLQFLDFFSQESQIRLTHKGENFKVNVFNEMAP